MITVIIVVIGVAILFAVAWQKGWLGKDIEDQVKAKRDALKDSLRGKDKTDGSK